jgi:Fe2+ transport system protein FeoA
MGRSQTLSDLPIGTRARVLRIVDEDASGERLLDLGFLPGTPVMCRRRAPLGDPRVYELRGVQLCLRRSEAQRILVEAGE